eukprot:TRINITY_DN24437_c0_g1_i5.p2 TRINITY_DN24437_c0_g1~~TRINITY_DN24437_c0_g1_i5.p2  ORF type:complete len:200 (+),score=39.03 TRINITY_DN24437_c0_g1_i5:250-849(+)
MGKAKKTRKFAQVKRVINTKKDVRITLKDTKNRKERESNTRHIDALPASMYFKANTALGPPYHVLVDTNFINFSIQNKIDIKKGMMDCLYAECFPCITDCVMAELEKLGSKFRLALKIAKDECFERLPAMQEGNTYADDDLVARVQAHRIYIVATCDKDLKRRLRKIPGVPIMSIKQRKYVVERMPGGGVDNVYKAAPK